MKTVRVLSLWLCVSCMILGFGCEGFDSGTGPEESEDVLAATELAKITTANYEYASVAAADVNLADQDAIFSVGWGKFYNPKEETVQDRSDAFAVAPNDEATTLSGRGRGRVGGQDMGTVTLSYDGGSIELLKVELESGGILYNHGKRRPGNPRGMLHEDEGEVSEAIPYIPGGTYRFDASGSDSFTAVSLEITAPAEVLAISSPLAGTSIDGSSGLEVKWQGSDSGQKIMVGLVPRLDREAFQANLPDPGARDFGGEFNGPGQGPRHKGGGPRGPGKNQHMHFRYVVEENTGSFTIPAEDIQEILALGGVEGLLVQVRQMVTTEVTEGDAQYAIQLRAGDAVELTIGQ